MNEFKVQKSAFSTDQLYLPLITKVVEGLLLALTTQDAPGLKIVAPLYKLMSNLC